MKRLVALMAFLAVSLFSTISTEAQGPPQPPSGGHGSSTNQTPAQGGGAPIGSGLAIMLGLGAGYTLIKVRENKNKEM